MSPDVVTGPGVIDCRDPFPQLHQLRARTPVAPRPGPGGRTEWHLYRYADVRQALTHPDLVRAGPVGIPSGDPLAAVRCTVLNLDPPAHTRLRRLLTPGLGAGRVRALQTRIDALVAELTGAMGRVLLAGGQADVLADLARPLQAIIAAEVVGLPVADVGLFRSWSDDIAGSDPARISSVGREFVAYVEAAIAAARSRPDATLLARLVAVEGGRVERGDGEHGGIEHGGIEHGELVSSLFQLLLAGDETSANLIGNGMLELLRHPDQLALLAARPALLGRAVEELARFNGPVGHTRHLCARAELTLPGARPGATVRVRRGDVVVPVLLAANRDPAAFADPDRLDLTRHPNRHVAFGHGSHLCLGAHLGRVLARAAVGALVHRFPTLTLAVAPGALQWTPHLFVHGVRRLPVALA